MVFSGILYSITLVYVYIIGLVVAYLIFDLNYKLLNFISSTYIYQVKIKQPAYPITLIVRFT